MSAQPLPERDPLDAQRFKATDVLERCFTDDYGEASDALLEAIAEALLYVGDCLRGRRL